MLRNVGTPHHPPPSSPATPSRPVLFLFCVQSAQTPLITQLFAFLEPWASRMTLNNLLRNANKVGAVLPFLLALVAASDPSRLSHRCHRGV